MGMGQRDWGELKRMKGHQRHGTGTGGTGGDEIEEGVASQLLPWVQAVPVGASLSRGPGTWEKKMFFDLFAFKLGIMFVTSSKEKNYLGRTIIRVKGGNQPKQHTATVTVKFNFKQLSYFM